MTALVRYDWEASFWRSATEWLDRLAATNYCDHVELLEMSAAFDDLDYELWQVSMDIDEVTVLGKLAAHDLRLRLEDSDTVFARKWSHPAIRRSAECRMRELHEMILGPITGEEEVVYSVLAQWPLPDVQAYVQATRQLREARHEHRDSQTSYFDLETSVTVVRTPLWAHRLLIELTSATLEEQMLASLTAEEREACKRMSGAPTPGAPCFDVDDELLRSALVLWDPGDSYSVYREFAAAAAAACML